MFSFISALLVVLSLMVLPASAVNDQQPLHVPAGEPFIYAQSPDNGATLSIYFTDNDELFLGVINGDVYCASVNSTQFELRYNTSVFRRSSTDSGDSVSGVLIWFAKLYLESGYFPISSIPVFPSLTAFMTGIVNYEPESASAILVPPGGSYTWQTGRTIQNDSDVNIAVGAWYDGFDYGTCVASYENLVLPGIRNGVAMNYSLSNSDSITGLFYNAIYLSEGEPDPGVPVFQPLDIFLTSAAEVLGSYSPTVNSVNLGFYLEPGNVAYLNLTDLDVDISLKMTSSQYSADIPTYGSYFPGNQTYRFGASYPASGSDITFPISGSTNIPWDKDPDGARNIFGKTKSAVATLHPTANLVEIYNPYNYADDTGASYPTYVNNNKIWISVPGLARNGIRVYQLQDTFDPNTFWGITSNSPTNYSEYTDSENDPSDQEDPGITGWNNQDGDDTPTPGASQYNEAPQQQSITTILDNFLQRITGLFTPGYDAIRSLTQGASEFISQLSGLYSWLPAPVLSILTSAIIVAITIGVLKVFL